MTGLFWLLLIVVLIAVLGGAVVGVGLWLLWYALIGLAIGGLARLLVSGTRGLGLFTTVLAGLVGSIGGGAIANHFDVIGLLSLAISVLVAAVVIALAASTRDRDATG